jgi:hypothetical protein
MRLPHIWPVYAMCLVLTGLPASGAPRITVGPNVDVSTPLPGSDHFEVMMDADPARANNLIAIRVDSDWADVAAVTTDNAQTQEGIIWNFELADNRQTLTPKAKTKPKHLVFQISNIKPVSNAVLEKQLESGLVDFKLRVYAQ